jgi:hypothetical protein
MLILANTHAPSVPDGEANSFGSVLLTTYTLHMSLCCVKVEDAHPSENIPLSACKLIVFFRCRSLDYTTIQSHVLWS